MTALMYHDIVPLDAPDSSGFPGRDAALYKVTPEQFRGHLDAIERAVAARGVQAPVITFDDGGVGALEAAAELERHGRRGCFFITTDYIGTPGFLTPEHLRDLHSRGHLVGSHSCSHPLRMAHCPPRRIRDEWVMSRRRLEDVLGDEVRVGSVPGGDFDDGVAEAAAEAGYAQLFNSEPGAAERRVGSIVVSGRYTIQRWTSAPAVAGLATGAWLPHSRQVVAWATKKLGKRIAGGGYLRMRERVLGASGSVRWGEPRQ